jgi:hypothetical protein
MGPETNIDCAGEASSSLLNRPMDWPILIGIPEPWLFGSNLEKPLSLDAVVKEAGIACTIII